MLKRSVRMIARLDVKNENVINTIQLEGLRVVGSPNSLATKYYHDGIDEILLIDQVASLYQRGHLLDLTKQFADNVFIPITAGGGIGSVDEARSLLRAGADKVAVNTQAIKNPNLISDLANEFGTQCIVASIQAKSTSENDWEAFTDGGRERTGVDAVQWAKQAAELGAGELLITSIDRDGTRKGFDVDLMAKISSIVSVPVIASGGFGKPDDAKSIFENTYCEAIAIADFLHMSRGSVPEVKEALINSGLDFRD